MSRKSSCCSTRSRSTSFSGSRRSSDPEQRAGFAELVSAELFESLLELHTPVCATVADAGRELRRLREHALAVADAEGLRLGSAGTHPFSLFERQRVTGRERYRVLVDELQYAARRELIFGLHVHVAVDDPDRAVRIISALQAHLCELVALSANSPFWRGQPTGLASCRHLIFSAFPRSGPPPHFGSYEEFATVVAELEACGCLEDYTRIWWDVRPHPRFGTIEVRVMDALSSVEDTVALTAYVQALIARYLAADRAGELQPVFHPVLTHENKWRAARYGLQATVIDLARGGPVPVARLIERTLAEIAAARARRRMRSRAGRHPSHPARRQRGRAPAQRLRGHGRHAPGRARHRRRHAGHTQQRSPSAVVDPSGSAPQRASPNIQACTPGGGSRVPPPQFRARQPLRQRAPGRVSI